MDHGRDTLIDDLDANDRARLDRLSSRPQSFTRHRLCVCCLIGTCGYTTRQR